MGVAELAVMTDPAGESNDVQHHGASESANASPDLQQQHAPRLAGAKLNLSRLVHAARKSFELTARDQQADPNAPPPTMKRYYTQALWLDHQAGMHVAHAPPPAMVDVIPPESEEDEHEYVEHVDLKAISLQGLREFVRMHNISPSMTTKQVVRSIILPATMGRQNCAIIDTESMSRFALPPMDSPGAAAARKAAGPLPPYTRLPKRRAITGLKRRAPYYYVVHAWSRPFMEMVNMLETYFAGRPAEHTYVWLDVFAVPQVSSNHSGFIQEIQRAIWYATSTLACFDPAGTILGRLWCLYEIFYTFVSKQCAHALVALTSAPLSQAQRTALYRKIDSAKAQCAVKEDKKKLVEHIYGYTRRGFPAINNYIRSGLMLPPYDHSAVYLPQLAYESKTGLFSCLPCTAPPPPPPPPAVPEHVAMVPEVAEPSVRKGESPYGGSGTAGGYMAQYTFEERPLRLVMGACNIPHPLKTKTGGEDAFFISPAGRGALGVADGVGSWSADDGIDPAAYSRDLMRATAASLEASSGRIGARMALADAHLSVKHAGSSTVLVGVLPPESNTLQVINVGDSGMRLVRGGRLAMATRPQAHAHNMPYQLACPDEPVCDTDSTVQGDLYNIPLEAGDIIIMATDGMYDNVWPDKMLEIVNKAMSAVEEDALLAAAASMGMTHYSAATTATGGAVPSGMSMIGSPAVPRSMLPLPQDPQPWAGGNSGGGGGGCYSATTPTADSGIDVAATNPAAAAAAGHVKAFANPNHGMSSDGGGAGAETGGLVTVASSTLGGAPAKGYTNPLSVEHGEVTAVGSADGCGAGEEEEEASVAADAKNNAAASAASNGYGSRFHTCAAAAAAAAGAGAGAGDLGRSYGQAGIGVRGPVAEAVQAADAAAVAPPLQLPAAGPSAFAAAQQKRQSEEDDGIGKHAPVAGDNGEAIRADASSLPLPPNVISTRAAALARTLARTAAANMLRRDIRTPFAVELSKQPSATAEFRTNPRGGKPDDVTVVVAVVVEADEAAMAGISAAAAAMARSSISGVPLDNISGRLPSLRSLSAKTGAAAGRGGSTVVPLQ